MNPESIFLPGMLPNGFSGQIDIVNLPAVRGFAAPRNDNATNHLPSWWDLFA
jgi:hypothetical protein